MAARPQPTRPERDGMLAELDHGCPGREALFPEPLSRAGVGKKAGELCHVGDVNVLCQALGEPPGQFYCGNTEKDRALAYLGWLEDRSGDCRKGYTAAVAAVT